MEHNSVLQKAYSEKDQILVEHKQVLQRGEDSLVQLKKTHEFELAKQKESN